MSLEEDPGFYICSEALRPGNKKLDFRNLHWNKDRDYLLIQIICYLLEIILIAKKFHKFDHYLFSNFIPLTLINSLQNRLERHPLSYNNSQCVITEVIFPEKKQSIACTVISFAMSNFRSVVNSRKENYFSCLWSSLR